MRVFIFSYIVCAGLREWLCVILLAIGVSMVESSQHEISPHHASNIIGVISVFTACITSGFAGIAHALLCYSFIDIA